MIGSDLDVARTLAPGTHASGPHLIKTLVTSNAYGVVTKGNGDAFINENTATALSTGGGQAGQGYPCVLEDKSETGCLNPWDVQSKHIQPEDGIAESLYAAECRYGGGESYVMQTGSYQDTTGALCAAGYSKLGVQEAANDMYVVTSPTPTPQNVTYAIDRASNRQGIVQSRSECEIRLLNRERCSTDIGSKRSGRSNDQFVTKDDTVGSLCASDYKGIRNQDIDDGKWIIQKSE